MAPQNTHRNATHRETACSLRQPLWWKDRRLNPTSVLKTSHLEKQPRTYIQCCTQHEKRKENVSRSPRIPNKLSWLTMTRMLCMQTDLEGSCNAQCEMELILDTNKKPWQETELLCQEL